MGHVNVHDLHSFPGQLSVLDPNWWFDIYTLEMFLAHISDRNTSTAGPFCLLYTQHMCPHMAAVAIWM